VLDTGLGLAQTLLIKQLFALQVILDCKTLEIGSRSLEAILEVYCVESSSVPLSRIVLAGNIITHLD